jgi:hypothetical protein
MPVNECRPPFEHVQLGITMENQDAVKDRWHWMQEASGLCGFSTFISYEPALGPVDWSILETGACDWLICGGESGPNARPMHPDWARSARDAAARYRVPFHFKQWGEWAPGECASHAATRTERTAEFFKGKWIFGTVTPRQSEEMHRDDEPDLYRLGKSRAGRSLDGIEHNGFPEPFIPAADLARELESDLTVMEK